MLSLFTNISVVLLALSIFYWLYYLDKYKKDERAEQILGKASKFTYSTNLVVFGFVAIFYMNDTITTEYIGNFIIIGLSVGSTLHAVLLMLFNSKMS